MKFVTLSAAALLTAGTAIAQTTVTTETTTTQYSLWNNHWGNNSGELYTSGELSFDAFGSYLSGEHKIENVFHNTIRHGVWGGGAGLNYFFTRNIGVGGDIEIPDVNGGNFVNNIDGSLIARFPIANTGLAPYVFGGGGRQTNPIWEWTGHAGVGLEYRFSPITGIFTDARYVWVDKTPDEILFRAGVRFIF